MMAPILTKHMNKAEAREKALELLDKVGLKDKADAADIAQKMADAAGMLCWTDDGMVRYFSQILFHE